MRTLRIVSSLLLGSSVAACGGSSGDPPTGTNRPAASVQATLSSPEAMAAIGDTRTVTATVRDANQAVIAGAPVSFSSNNLSVATVSGSGSTATITATGNGEATITATSGSATGTVSVTVAQRLTNVTLVVSPVTMGSTLQLQPVARDSRDVPIAGATGFTFASANPSTAVVGSSGLVTGIAPGTTSISVSVTRDGVTADGNATLTVTQPAGAAGNVTVAATAASTFDPQNVTIGRGGTVTFSFGSLEHNVQFQSAGAPANIGNTINANVARIFPTVGSFPYVCTLHSGMTGTVTVVEGGFLALMNGQKERPTPNSSTATGAAWFSRSGATVNYVITFQGLSGAPTGVHLHGPADAESVAGVLVGFSTAGQSTGTGVLTGSFTEADIQGMTLDALMALLQDAEVYVNVHTAQFPDGEIRGQA